MIQFKSLHNINEETFLWQEKKEEVKKRFTKSIPHEGSVEKVFQSFSWISLVIMETTKYAKPIATTLDKKEEGAFNKNNNNSNKNRKNISIKI